MAVEAVVFEDGAGIVELVGAGHEADRGRGVFDVSYVGFFSLPPGRLRFYVGISAAIDYRDYPFTEAIPDLAPHFRAALVFDGVMQKSCDSFVLVSTVFEGNACDPDEMRNIRDFASFADLPGMKFCGIGQCVFESLPEDRVHGFHGL